MFWTMHGSVSQNFKLVQIRIDTSGPGYNYYDNKRTFDAQNIGF